MIESLVSTEASELHADQAFWGGLKPDPIVTVTEWSDQYRVLAQVSSAMPGRWKTSRAPYLKEIQDELSITSAVQEVVFKKGAQIGGTEIGNNWIAYLIDCSPGPIMSVSPTLDLAKRSSKTRIKPLIEYCERIKHKIKSSKSRDGGNTQLMKEFENGVLILSGASSAVSLRSQPVRFLMLDEIDGYVEDVDGEGDPVALAEARTRTYIRRKIYKVSTPTFEGRSKIDSAWEESDKRRYYVPCPHCQEFQWLKWAQVQWPKTPVEEPLKAYYVCEFCEKHIAERYKKWMLEQGKWIAENPGAAGGKVAGFHLSALYSPFGSYTWGDAARAWVKAQGNPEKLREFVNTVLGECWSEKGDAPDWLKLYARREEYAIGSVPDSVLMITSGVDVQKDRLECEVIGWTRDKRSYSLDYIVIPGDTAKDEVWTELDRVLSRVWMRSNGLEMLIKAMGVDTGYNTQHVYNWARRHPKDRVIPVKGVENLTMIIGLPSAQDVNLGGVRIRRGVQLWPVGTSIAKNDLYSLLKMEAPTEEELKAGKEYPRGYCHFPQYGDEYFKQLTAEQVVVRIVRGNRRYQFEKTRDRNEALDCRIYGRAAAAAVGLDRYTDRAWDVLERSVGVQAPIPKVVKDVEGREPDTSPPVRPGPPPRRRRSFL